MSRGMPSMMALLGLLAVAGYQNRDKIAEVLGGRSKSPAADPGRTLSRAAKAACSASWAGFSAVRVQAESKWRAWRPNRALQAERSWPGGGFLGQDRSQSTTRPATVRASDRS